MISYHSIRSTLHLGLGDDLIKAMLIKNLRQAALRGASVCDLPVIAPQQKMGAVTCVL